MVASSNLIKDVLITCNDVLITCNIVGATRLAELKELSKKVKLPVVADSRAVIEGLSRTFSDAPAFIVLVERNTDANRCGMASPETAEEFAVAIDSARRPIFGGLMTYPPAGGEKVVQAFMAEAKARIEK